MCSYIYFLSRSSNNLRAWIADVDFRFEKSTKKDGWRIWSENL